MMDVVSEATASQSLSNVRKSYLNLTRCVRARGGTALILYDDLQIVKNTLIPALFRTCLECLGVVWEVFEGCLGAP